MLPTTETTPRPPRASERQREAVVAAEHGEIALGDDLRCGVHRAARFLDHRDVGQVRHADDRVGLDVLAGAAGDVVDADRNVDRFGQGLACWKKPFRSRLIVIGRDDERGIGAALGRPAREPQGFFGAVRAGARHDLDAPGRRLDHGRDHALVLRVRKRGTLARRAHRADAGRTGGNLELDVPLQGLDIDLHVAKRGNNGHGQAGKIFTAVWVRGLYSVRIWFRLTALCVGVAQQSEARTRKTKRRRKWPASIRFHLQLLDGRTARRRSSIGEFRFQRIIPHY